MKNKSIHHSVKNFGLIALLSATLLCAAYYQAYGVAEEQIPNKEDFPVYVMLTDGQVVSYQSLTNVWNLSREIRRMEYSAQNHAVIFWSFPAAAQYFNGRASAYSQLADLMDSDGYTALASEVEKEEDVVLGASEQRDALVKVDVDTDNVVVE